MESATELKALLKEVASSIQYLLSEVKPFACCPECGAKEYQKEGHGSDCEIGKSAAILPKIQEAVK